MGIFVGLLIVVFVDFKIVVELEGVKEGFIEYTIV